MNIIAKFIGVNKYNDKGIRDLSGAKNDARAMWALFTDTVPSLQAELITDADATTNNIKNAIDSCLDAASEEDVVILYYAGHGTPDYRLTSCETDLSTVPLTTIPMNYLADKFKTSKAKSILCMMDCCFSGGAPARVIETSLVPRDPQNILDILGGKGRLIIAACTMNQPAYESPTSAHGLFTKALIDTLTTGEGVIDLATAMDSVMGLVRTEAAKMGYEQTPSIVNYTEGGLSLPVLKRGSAFYSYFPETNSLQADENINNLSIFGLPATLTDGWKTLFTKGLNTLQQDAINIGRILDNKSLLVVAPTSSGKTFIGELATGKSLIAGKKAAFLLPYKALVNEKYDQFKSLYGDKLGYTVIRCTGDYQDQNNEFIQGKFDIALLTYEMFNNLILNKPVSLNNLGLVVLDEAQFITDPLRGIVVELLLTNLISARQRGIEPQLIVLSAVIGDINNFDKWLSCNKLITYERPVPLVEGSMDRSGSYMYKDSSGNIGVKQLIPSSNIHQRKDKPGFQDMIVPLVKSLVLNGEKVIIFRNQRGNAEGCAAYLSQDLGLEPAADVIQQLPTHDTSTTSNNLRECLSGGVAFHNSNLLPQERLLIERAFRDPTSKVRVLAATTTVAAGLNTPASTVIMAEHEFLGEDGRQFTIAEYKNMSGRAGRLGYSEEGKSIILANVDTSKEFLFQRYVNGALEKLRSSFDIKELDTWIIRLLSQIKKAKKDQMLNLLTNTYGGYCASIENPNWKTSTQLELNSLLERMLSVGLVELEEDNVQLTLLGTACGQSALKFSSALRLVEILKTYTVQDITVERLSAIIQALPEMDASWTPLMKTGTTEEKRTSECSQRYGSDITVLLQRFVGGDRFVYLGRCKRAAIIFDWAHGVPINTIETTFTTNPYRGKIGSGDIRKFADLTRFHLRSAFQIAQLIFPDKEFDSSNLDAMLKKLEVGIPSEGLLLLEIPYRFTRGEYLSLLRAKIKTSEELKSKTSMHLAAVLEPDTIKILTELKLISE